MPPANYRGDDVREDREEKADTGVAGDLTL